MSIPYQKRWPPLIRQTSPDVGNVLWTPPVKKRTPFLTCICMELSGKYWGGLDGNVNDFCGQFWNRFWPELCPIIRDWDMWDLAPHNFYDNDWKLKIFCKNALLFKEPLNDNHFSDLNLCPWSKEEAKRQKAMFSFHWKPSRFSTPE